MGPQNLGRTELHRLFPSSSRAGVSPQRQNRQQVLKSPGQKHMLHVADFENRWSSRMLQNGKSPGQKHMLHVADYENRWRSCPKEKDLEEQDEE